MNVDNRTPYAAYNPQQAMPKGVSGNGLRRRATATARPAFATMLIP